VKRSDEETARVTQEITARAIRRLDILEWLIFAGAAGLAVVGGGLLALLLAGPLGFDSDLPGWWLPWCCS
jgi:hypothetical protein